MPTYPIENGPHSCGVFSCGTGAAEKKEGERYMATLSIRKRAGKYRICLNGNTLHKDKDLEFVKGWLKNQVSDFKSLFIEI